MKAPLLIAVGTRPEIIKMAPVHQALVASGERVMLLHSGQHDSLAWPLYEFFGLRPDRVLEQPCGARTLAQLSSGLLTAVSGVLDEVRPRAVLVHGDTTTALMTALASFYQQIPVAHVEAGLRTGCAADPFPEEKNREMIARLAEWHFAPTPAARDNLLAEGVRRNVYVVGNTVVDATRWGVAHLAANRDSVARWLPRELAGVAALGAETRLLLVTAHRRESWGEGIESIARSVRDWLQMHPNYAAVWPVHGNPKVSESVRRILLSADPALRSRLFVCEPVNYPVLLWLLGRSWLVLTDSGGIQEEAAALDRPVLVLRNTTERPELIASGRGRLVGTVSASILSGLERLHRSPRGYAAMCNSPNPFGDGVSAQRIAAVLAGNGIGDEAIRTIDLLHAARVPVRTARSDGRERRVAA